MGEKSEADQALVFGAAAAAYDRARPAYPRNLVSDVIAASQRASSYRALEVGSGTGKATELFAEYGMPLLCIEPSDAMTVIARRRCANHSNVAFVGAKFEDWETPERFGLIFSAQSWHWIDPAIRLTKARHLLLDDGALALFWNRQRWDEMPSLREGLDAVYDRIAPTISMRARTGPGSLAEDEESIAEEIRRCSDFSHLATRRYEWTESRTASEYIELLQTESEHQLLPVDVRERLTDGLTQVLSAETTGSITMEWVTTLHVARPS